MVSLQTHPNLYLRLVCLTLQVKQNPKNDEYFKFASEKASPVFSTDFLNSNHAKKYLSRIQKVAREFTRLLIEAQKPIQGLIPLSRAIQYLRSAKSQVSSLHTCYAQLALKSRCLQHSLVIIEHPITSVMTGTNPLEIMTYNFYRGMIYTGLQRFEQAMECFRKVLAQPTNLVHKVHEESY